MDALLKTLYSKMGRGRSQEGAGFIITVFLIDHETSYIEAQHERHENRHRKGQARGLASLIYLLNIASL